MHRDQEGTYAKGVEQIVDQLSQEFIDEIRETLDRLMLMVDDVRHEKVPLEDLVDEVRRLSLHIKGQARNYAMPALDAVAMRAEDYLANVKHFLPRTLDDLQTFVEKMIDLLEMEVGEEPDISKLVRSLPAKVRIEESILDVRNVEVLLVMQHGAATHFVERELQECGYRVSTCTSTINALGLIVHTKPDLVIISAMMPELTGIDLASALAEMPQTRNIPTALITSLPEDDPYLQLLNKRVPIIHKSASFGDDLADALSNLFLI